MWASVLRTSTELSAFSIRLSGRHSRMKAEGHRFSRAHDPWHRYGYCVAGQQVWHFLHPDWANSFGQSHSWVQHPPGTTEGELSRDWRGLDSRSD